MKLSVRSGNFKGPPTAKDITNTIRKNFYTILSSSYSDQSTELIGQLSRDVIGRLSVTPTNIISTSLTNQANNQRQLYHLLMLHNLLDSKDDFCSDCRHISQCHPDDHNLYM